MLAYIVPFMAIGWFILIGNSGKSLQRLIIAVIIFLFIVVIYYVFYLIVEKSFIIQNSFLFLLTYGSFLFFLVIPPKAILHKLHFKKYMQIIKIFIALQSILGILQICMYILLNGGNLDAATGDIVQGTLDPLSFLNQQGNFNNQIYTTNLLVLLLFYTPYAVSSRKGIWVCILGFIAIIFASVWHVLLSFLAAVVIISLYFSHSFIKLSGTRLLIAGFLLLVIALTAAFQPKNFGLINYYYHNVTSFESPKAIVTKESVTELPKEYPWVYFIGLGPGQYCSRAGLIGSGNYFGEFSNPKKLPVLEAKSSKAFEKYIYSKWEEFATNPAIYGNSTMSRPFYSILALFVELGYIAFAILSLSIGFLIRKIRRLYNLSAAKKNPLTALYALACAILIAFLAFISFFENYLEVSHAIFLGLLLFRYFFSFIKDQRDSENLKYNSK